MKITNLLAIAIGFVLGLPKQAVSTTSYVVEKTRVKLALDDINRELSRPERLSEDRLLELEFAKLSAEELLREGEGHDNNPAPGFVERLKGFNFPKPFGKDPVDTVQNLAIKK